MKENFFVQKFNDWWGGFSNSNTGQSGKKLTAASVTTTGICYPMIKYADWATIHNDWSLFPVILGILVGFISGLFAINTWDKKANGTNETTEKIN
jgi:hypothetical protein